MVMMSRRDALRSVAAGSTLSVLPACATLRQPTPARFTHGVASGDPQTDRVILWTRAEPKDGGTEAVVSWAVADDESFSTILAEGQAATNAARDFTVKVDAAGLRPGRSYAYRFVSGDGEQVTGRTKTLPEGQVEAVRLAVVSCSNHPAGYFNVYRALADRRDIDAVLHLGDYIYEYGPGGYATQFGERVGRIPEPEKEIVTLDDYRTRYAQYRSDEDLQAAHAAHPFITIWDDHESTNNSWKGGAENHDPDEGEGRWSERRTAAMRAYFEWLPVRTEGETGDPLSLNRAFHFGDLASLIMLETRLQARSRQLEYQKDLPLQQAYFEKDRPVMVPEEEARRRDPADLVRRPIPFELGTGEPTAITDPERLAQLDPDNLPATVTFLPDIEAFREKLMDPSREMLGSRQRERIRRELAKAKTRGAPWRILGNQIIMAKVSAPDLAERLTPAQKQAVEQRFDGAGRLIALSRFGLPLNLDAWDGYPVARERLYSDIEAEGGTLVVVTGDTHAFWANTLTTAAGQSVGAEFGTSSVTSPSIGAILNVDGFDIGEAVTDANDTVLMNEVNTRGYLHVTFTREEAIGEFVGVNTIYDRTFETRVLKRYKVKAGSSEITQA